MTQQLTVQLVTKIKNKKMKNLFKTVKGEIYYFGDPCYAIPDSQWSKFVDDFYLCESNSRELTGFYVELSNGSKCFVANTAYGDGSYRVTAPSITFSEAGVDAGLLSIIKVSDILAIGGTIPENEPCFIGTGGTTEVIDGDWVGEVTCYTSYEEDDHGYDNDDDWDDDDNYDEDDDESPEFYSNDDY
jgi:hypothetical protein